MIKTGLFTSIVNNNKYMNVNKISDIMYKTYCTFGGYSVYLH